MFTTYSSYSQCNRNLLKPNICSGFLELNINLLKARFLLFQDVTHNTKHQEKKFPYLKADQNIIIHNDELSVQNEKILENVIINFHSQLRMDISHKNGKNVFSINWEIKNIGFYKYYWVLLYSRWLINPKVCDSNFPPYESEIKLLPCQMYLFNKRIPP